MSHSQNQESASHSWFSEVSPWVAWTVTICAIVVAVPLFLRMPPWCDQTLYDVAAKNILSGGIHYQDVFDTNLPGYVWILCLIRSMLGWSSEAVRLVDLGVVTGIVLLLNHLARRAGASRASRAWAVSGVAMFYPFTSEFNHCQRDVWMMLPSLVAVLLRSNRICATTDPTRSVFRDSFLEGIFWGLAVWIKPHVLIPAACVWLVTARRIPTQSSNPLVWDFLGNLTAGLLLGAIGVAYLIASGTWQPFLEVFTFWNQGYFIMIMWEMGNRFNMHFHYFAPWCYLQVVSLPLAVLAVVDAEPWRRSMAKKHGPIGRRLPRWAWEGVVRRERRTHRMILAVLYLAWTAQAFFLQRSFHYVHIPEILFLLFVLAELNRFSGGVIMFFWLTITSTLVLAQCVEDQTPEHGRIQPYQQFAWVVLHPAFDWERTKEWPECWRFDLTEQEYLRRYDRVKMVYGFSSAGDWEQLGEVTAFLRTQNVHDGNFVGWHDSPHVLALFLDVKPGFRFQHISHILTVGDAQEVQLMKEFCNESSHIDYVVSDLLRVHVFDDTDLPDIHDPGPEVPSAEYPALVPTTMHPAMRHQFPFNQPAVFRTQNGRGRYIVHRVVHPIPECAKYNP